ncbi:hypothetical protein [Kordiimonas aestuarii]|uniref:hypothetical protein n=1 Tax=Kordiimonas aestuarii TaxID=1005925 RepID=UPI0021CF7937|nr:hypothetical protein [Kordiimonas aestuarii]
MYRKGSTGAIIASMMVFSGTPVMSANEIGTVSIKFAGEKDWAAECTFHKASGKARDVRRTGRGFNSIKSIAMRSVMSGKCSLNVPDETTLKVTFSATGPIDCPFEDKENCTAIFASSGKIMFSF